MRWNRSVYMLWQIVEKDDYATDWALVRYDPQAINRFPTEEEAISTAKKYLTDRNCNNALTKLEKRASVEAFMMTKEGCFLGVLDGVDWYLLDRNNKPVSAKYYELEGRAEVKVRPVPGT